MTAGDWGGVATCIGAITGGVTSIVIAWRQRGVIATANQVADQVATPGDATLGETVAHVHAVVCNEAEPDTAPK